MGDFLKKVPYNPQKPLTQKDELLVFFYFDKLEFIGENDVGLCPTPRKLLKKLDQNFCRIGLLKLHVILSREGYTRRKESKLSLSAAWLAAYMFFSL